MNAHLLALPLHRGLKATLQSSKDFLDKDRLLSNIAKFTDGGLQEFFDSLMIGDLVKVIRSILAEKNAQIQCNEVRLRLSRAIDALENANGHTVEVAV